MNAHFPICEKHAHLTTDDCPLCTEDILRARVAELESGIVTVQESLQKTRDASAAVHALGRLINP